MIMIFGKLIWSWFLVNCVKWWYLQEFFFRFLKFWFFGLLGAKNSPKWQKILSYFISQEQYIIWLSFVVCLCKMIISPVVFSIFPNLIFQVLKGVKGKKTVQNDKKFCPSRSISQEPDIIWLSFMVYMCIMMISPAFPFFSFFCKFWYFGLMEG